MMMMMMIDDDDDDDDDDNGDDDKDDDNAADKDDDVEKEVHSNKCLYSHTVKNHTKPLFEFSDGHDDNDYNECDKNVN
jgi:hypothetical protein